MKKAIIKSAYYLSNKYKCSAKKRSLKKNLHKISDCDSSYAERFLKEKREKIPVDYLIENKKSNKDLSIIIPVYNCENYIGKCLESIIEQNLKMDYEIICVNDGSTDNSLDVIRKIAESNQKIIVISQENRGISVARNIGLNNATGRYILFVDSDDYICDNSINHYYERIVSEKADIIIGRISKYITKYDTEFPLKYSRRVNNIIDLCNNTTGTAWGKIYKRELWDDIRFFDGYMYEDSIVFLNIFIKAKKIITDPMPMYAFRSSSNSSFKKSKKNYSTIDMLWLMETMNEKGYFDKLDNYQFQLVLWNLSIIVYERISCLDDDETLECSFVKSRDVLNSIRQKNKTISLDFYGKNKDNYLKILESYDELDFYKWKYYCGIVNCSCVI